MAKGKLTPAQQAFVVQGVACFDTPKVVAEALKKEYGVAVSAQAVEAYDPTKRAGRNLANRWKVLFEETRKKFLEGNIDVPIAHRAVRLRTLQRMLEKAEDRNNLPFAANLLEQAARECGGAFTNQRQLSGPDGKPIQVQPVTATMTAKEAAAAYAETLAGGAHAGG